MESRIRLHGPLPLVCALAASAQASAQASAPALRPVQVERRWGFADAAGQLRIPARYYWVEPFSEGLAYVDGKGKDAGYLDREGKFVIHRRFAKANPFREGLAGVQPRICGKWGILDRGGREILPPKYDRIALFSEGLAAVCLSFKWGYVDRKGKLVIPCKFASASDFKGGEASVRLGRKGGTIDRQGKFSEVETPPAKPAAEVEPPSGPSVEGALILGPERHPAKKVTRWGNPYRDRYPDAGERVYSRNIRDMMLYRGRIYVGAGDYWSNTGPIPIYSFAPGSRRFRHEYTAPDEMVANFYVFGNRLIAPSNDPRESWAFGNLYTKHRGRWKKQRTIPQGLHCFKLAMVGKSIYAIVSTANGSKLVQSSDWGESWTEIRVHRVPTLIFALQGRLCGLDYWDTLYRLEDGYLLPEPLLPWAEEAVLPGRRRTGAIHPYGRALEYAGGILLLPSFGSVHKDRPQRALRFLDANSQKPRDVPSFPGRWICDALIRRERLLLLCTEFVDEGFRNLIYETSDLKIWRSIASFESDSFARSFEEARGDYYVSLGSNHPRSGQEQPSVTGEILRITPAPRLR